MNKAPLSGERKKSQSSTTKSRSSSVPRGRHNAISLRNSYGKHDSKKSSSEDEEESSSESESEMSESDETVDIKVSIAHAHEVRGFSVHVRRGFTKIMRQLEECYGSRPKLSYYDDDGDRVSILASTDFEYAVRIHKNMTSIQKKSKKMGANKLTLIAEFIQHISLSDIRIRSTSRSLDSLLQKSLDASLDLDACRDTIHTVSGSTKEKTEDREKGRTELCEVLWQRGELLGSGSFGQVFSGIDMSTGLRIAVKEVNLGRGARHEQQAFALLREIKILSTLDHPNIIKYLGTEYSHHTMRIFLELATEGSIKDALTAFGKLRHGRLTDKLANIIDDILYLLFHFFQSCSMLSRTNPSYALRWKYSHSYNRI